MYKTFRHKGKEFVTEIMSATMVLLDSCDCVYVHDDLSKWLHSFQNCKLHKKTGQSHMNEALAHHQPFNRKYTGDNVTKAQNDEMSADRITEKMRIEKL